MEKIMSLMGLAVFIGVAWLLSVDRRNVQWKPVLWGVGLQIIIAVVVLHPTMQQFSLRLSINLYCDYFHSVKRLPILLLERWNHMRW